jgi:UDP-N-acetylmuramyl pentapeptide phosphotransferase/UDP-N-acetylglucosamine-1-phosphate transferase
MAAAVIALLAVLSMLLATAGCDLLRRAGIADAPDHKRKAHRDPTPTAGGLAVVAAASVALILAVFFARGFWAGEAGPGPTAHLAAAWLGGLVIMAIGLADDLYDLRAGVKFGLIGILCIGFSFFVARVETIGLWPGAAILLGPVFGALGSALWLFVMANGVNFMDGANGLAMGSSALGLLALALYAAIGGASGPALAALLIAAALCGFLYWNFPSGRIFAGDAGALFVGFMAGALALLAIQEARLPVLLAPLLFMPMLADVLLTMLWRARRKRNLLEAHRDHLYQVALRAGAGHPRTAIGYWLAMIHCALAAGVSLVFGDAGALAAFVGTALLFVYLSWMGRRFAEARGLDTP